MNSDFLRREWGAVAFLIATLLGVIVVPVGLNLNKRNVPAATESLVGASPSPSASPAPSAPPAPTPSPSPSPSEAPSPAPTDTGAPTPSPTPS